MKAVKRNLLLTVLCLALSVMILFGFGLMKAQASASLSVDGASLRLSIDDGRYGIRYAATVPAADYDSGAKYGFEIVPFDLKADTEAIKSAYGEVEQKGLDYAYSVDLLDILPANTSRPFTARAFKEVDGNKTYTEWTKEKSIFTLATQALADKTETYEGEDLEFLQNTVKTVFGIDSTLTGKYVLNNYVYEDTDGNKIDIEDLVSGATFTVKMDVVKQGEPTKVLKAYPVVSVTDKDGNPVSGALEQVAGTQDTYVVKTDLSKGYSLKGEVAGEMVNTLTHDGVTVTDNKDGSYAVAMQPGQSEGISASGLIAHVGISSRTTYVNTYHAIGEYGVGYEFVTEFKGNNMPQIMLFANAANSQMAAGYNNGSDVGLQGQTGYILMNGWSARSGWAGTTGPMWQDFLNVYGPNRMGGMESNYNGSTAVPPTASNLTASESTDVSNTASTALSDDITYRYSVYTRVVADVVYINVSLKNAATNAVVYSGHYNTGKTVEEIESQGKNVVFYAGIKGNGIGTEFTYYTPNKDVLVTDNKDGSYDVKMRAGDQKSYMMINGTTSGVAIGSVLTKYVNNYLDIGEYGVGYEIVTEFKGNNMPQVMLFANSANHQITYGYPGYTDLTDQTGYFLVNGFAASATGGTSLRSAMFSDHLRVHGPSRISSQYNYNVGTAAYPPTTTNLTATEGTDIATTASTALSNDITYRYSVRTREVVRDAGTFVWIFVSLRNAQTGAVIYSGYYDTGKTITEVESLGKHVVFHAGIKGNAANTDFTYYTPNNSAIVTDNQDGSYDVKLLAGSDVGGYMSICGTTSSWAQSGVVAYRNNIVGVGEYGVGYKFVTTFKGNNLPQVLLFAENADDMIAQTDEQNGKGYYISNGFSTVGDSWGRTTFIYRNDWLYVYGTNRFAIGTNLKGLTQTNVTTATGAFPTTTNFSNDITYRYEVSTKEVGGLVVIYIELYNDATDAVIYKGEFNTNKTVTEVEALGKNVVFHAGIKGNAVNTEFTYYTPVLVG